MIRKNGKYLMLFVIIFIQQSFLAYAGWEGAYKIIGNSEKPHTAMNDAGDVMIVGTRGPASPYAIVAVRFDPVRGEFCRERVIGRGNYPRVAVDSFGNAVVCFAANNRLLYCYYNKERDSWSEPEKVSTQYIDPDMVGYNYSVASNSDGQCCVVWHYFALIPSPSRFIMYFSYFDFSERHWNETVEIAERSGGRVTMNNNGDAAVCWRDVDEDWRPVIFVKFYNRSIDAWSSPITVASMEGMGLSRNPITLDADGNLTVAWMQDRERCEDCYPIESRIYVRRYDALRDEWGAIIELDFGVEADELHAPKLSANDAGDAIVLWTRNQGIYVFYWDSNKYRWGEKQRLDRFSHNRVSGTDYYSAAMDESGSSTIIWIKHDSDGINRCYSKQYDYALGFGPRVLIGARCLNDCIVVRNNTAQAIACWSQERSGTRPLPYYITANRFMDD